MNGVVKRYQWNRNAEGGQKFGNRLEIKPLTEEAFNEYIVPRLSPGYASNLAEYRSKHPSVTHYASILRASDSEWKFAGIGSLDELEAEPKNSAWAIEVENFDSPEAVAHGSRADSDL
ncbi:MAG: hypothetical protein JW963_18070 [Anaerolineales bacterium]|nr:hypothetical protein [Anaerolineales bacterium]